MSNHLPDKIEEALQAIEKALGYIPEGAFYNPGSGRKGDPMPPRSIFQQAVWYLVEAKAEYGIAHEKESLYLYGRALSLLNSRGILLPDPPVADVPPAPASNVFRLHPKKP